MNRSRFRQFRWTQEQEKRNSSVANHLRATQGRFPALTT
jgi:hypothetical protein